MGNDVIVSTPTENVVVTTAGGTATAVVDEKGLAMQDVVMKIKQENKALLLDQKALGQAGVNMCILW